MTESRTKKSIKNLFFTIFTQISNLIIKFVGRTIFIRILGVEILGISGLFTNILTILSLAELGFGNAVIYSMYRPLKENNQKKLAALTTFYKKVYTIITIVIFIVGILFLPFLNTIVNLDKPIEYLHIYYLLFLFDTLSTYLFCYKQSILTANQEMYITKIVFFIVQLIQFILQMIIIIITKNYFLYLIIQVFCTLLNNIICSFIADKKYPFIKQKEELSKKEKKDILQNVKSLFLYKISGTILNNTDNIFISLLIGTTVVGYYSNYFMVTNAVNGIIYLIFTSITASVGNLMVENDNDKKQDIFLQLNLLCFVLTGGASIILFGILNDFITLWIGKEFLIAVNVVYVTIANFFVYDMQIPVWIYRDTTGLFKDAKNATIVLAVANIVLSYFLGIYFGLFGILAATLISRLCITSWQQPVVLYKKILHTSPKKYFMNSLYYIFILLIAIIPVYYISNMFIVNNFIDLILKTLIIGIIVIIIFVVFLFKTQEWKALKKRFINPILNKLKNDKK